MNNNYEDLKQIIKAVKKPETGVELMSYKYLFELFEKAFEDERAFFQDQVEFYYLSFMENPADKSAESMLDDCTQVRKTMDKEHQEIKKQFYKTLGGVEC